MLKNNHFVLFLDVDGVLCSYNNLKTRQADERGCFVPESIEALNGFISFYGIDHICMISGWNSFFKTEEEYRQFLISRGINVPGISFGDRTDRYNFVSDHIKDGLEHYIIIDDECYGYYTRLETIDYRRIVRTNMYRCLDMHDFQQGCREDLQRNAT